MHLAGPLNARLPLRHCTWATGLRDLRRDGRVDRAERPALRQACNPGDAA